MAAFAHINQIFINASTKELARPFHNLQSPPCWDSPIKLTINWDNILEEPKAKGFIVFDIRFSCGPIMSLAPVKINKQDYHLRDPSRAPWKKLANNELSPLPDY